jgi:hypothetical protein
VIGLLGGLLVLVPKEETTDVIPPLMRLGALVILDRGEAVLLVGLLGAVLGLVTRCLSDMAGADATDLDPCFRIVLCEFIVPN